MINFQNSFTGTLSIAFQYTKTQQRLKRVATLPCKYLYLKADNYISQGSVATCSRCGGIFSNHFIANLLLNVSVKKILDRSTLNNVVFWTTLHTKWQLI